jgi:hypothetical protein
MGESMRLQMQNSRLPKSERQRNIGFKLGTHSFILSNLIPNVIPYRRSIPITADIGIEIAISPWFHFELFGLYGKHNSDGNPFYCLECDVSKDDFTSNTELVSIGFRYPILKLQNHKKLWGTASLEHIIYEWQYHGGLRKLRAGVMESDMVFLGISSETYFVTIVSRLFLGIDAHFKIPVYQKTALDPAVDMEEKTIPVIGVGLRARY